MKKDRRIKNILASLYEMSQLVKRNGQAAESDLEKVRILMHRAFDFQLFSIFQFDYLENKLMPVFLYGDPYNLVDAVNFRLGKGATGWGVAHKKSILLKDLNRNITSNPHCVNSFLTVPIIINDQIVGTAVMGSLNRGEYNEGDLFLLEMITPYLSSLLLKDYFKTEKHMQQLNQKE
ncbi:MAG: hypothetical protein Kow0042_17620 [Calditrichia bacterium]